VHGISVHGTSPYSVPGLRWLAMATSAISRRGRRMGVPSTITCTFMPAAPAIRKPWVSHASVSELSQCHAVTPKWPSACRS